MDSVERAIAVMDYVATAGRPVAMAQISKQLSINKVSVWRTLSSLEQKQWIIKDSVTGLYTPGMGVLQLSVRLLSGLNLRSVSKPYLEKLNKDTQETVVLSVRVGLEHIFIESLESPQTIRFVTPLGIPIPLSLGATGKVILAYMEDFEKEQAISNLKKTRQKTYASGKAIDIQKIKDDLEEIRKRGFAVSIGERTAEAVAVTAPVFKKNAGAVGAIGAVGPVSRFTKDIAFSFGHLVSEAASKISQALL